MRGRNAISHSNRNFVLAYVFLVGLPVLGLVAVLKSGRGLNAPFSVDGAWKIDSGTGRLSTSPCGDFLSSLSNAPISISQSGKTLVVTLSGGTRTATGTIDGKALQAQFMGADSLSANRSGIAECSDRNLILAAILDPIPDPRTLNGTLSVEDCSSCAPVEFHAVRQPRSPGGTR